MRSKHQNLSAGPRWRAAGIAAPALAAVLALAGVVAKPVLGLERAEAQRELARSNAQACRAERAVLERYEAAHGEERAAEALRSLSARMPEDISPIDVFCVLRLLANAHRIELGSAKIAGAVPTGFAVQGERVMAREADVSGRGTLADWVRWTEDLQRCGYPVAVQELSVVRQSAQDTVFDVHLVIRLYACPPAAPEADDAAGGSR